MKQFVRLISVCSVASLGIVAVPSVASAETAESADVGTTSSAMHAHKAFKEALAELDLRPEQKEAIDELRDEGKERRAPVKKARRELMLAVADQVEEGKIDRCEVEPQIKKVASAVAEARPGDRAAFEKLHEILDPEQRAQFVESLQRRMEARKGKAEPRALVEKMDRELDLTDEQKQQVAQILSGLRQIYEAEPAHAEHHERWARILEAFKSDHFDLDKVAPMKDVAEKVTKRIEGHLWAAEAVLPVLTEQQRARLAEKLRDKAKGHSGTKHGASTGMDDDED